ncbi:hypothetical protein GA394_18915, partial [Bacteroides xylanisolvens]|uniref:hypothetical protein n=1 Tax=Bacteroides xylanisolvens TaxID=371601 RepID=UPI00125F31CD
YWEAIYYWTNVTILVDITNAILYLFERTVENAMVQIAWRRENDLVLLNIPLFSLFSLIFGDNYSFNGWL